MEVGAADVDRCLKCFEGQLDKRDDPVGNIVCTARESVDLDLVGTALGYGNAKLAADAAFAWVAIGILFTLEHGDEVPDRDAVGAEFLDRFVVVRTHAGFIALNDWTRVTSLMTADFHPNGIS